MTMDKAFNENSEQFMMTFQVFSATASFSSLPEDAIYTIKKRDVSGLPKKSEQATALV